MRLAIIISLFICLIGCRDRYLSDPEVKNDIGSKCFDGYSEECRILKQMCRAGDAKQCYWLGLVYENPLSYFMQDLEKADQAFAKACSLGNAEACRRLNPQ